jgi:hypothetical protein
MSQLRRNFKWFRVQWAEGGDKRPGIVFLLLLLSPFIVIYGLVVLVYEVIACSTARLDA